MRYALTEGLRLKDSIGNPFQYGMIGGTDTHLGTPGCQAGLLLEFLRRASECP